ncbi:conserved hypothetical protein [Altererythrobacter sp. B11]|uniref:hypothetical protein n=1 Tax=Altererythrobacter sp. B11 TaxID=2060312 RepID=UPI000DC71F82|nr:hypothetical protein [Altererythrobacter sp. B11]BBC73937.1 conserved hypothetical protein [Altererythrobacter sp. B11]
MIKHGIHHALNARRRFAPGLALAGAAALLGLASPAAAEPQPSTRLVRCGEASCLRVTGYRDDAAATVRINGYAVSAAGERRWEVDLPLETVRNWSAPHARSIEVSLGEAEAASQVALPIGLLGGVTDLAALVVSAS